MTKEQFSNADPECWVTTIANLISGHGAQDNRENCELWIPPYQRHYAWDESNVRRLCRDVSDAIVNGSADYHLGTLIFHKDTIPTEHGHKDIWAIVDGQQRLTTIGALLEENSFVHRRKGSRLSSDDMSMIGKVRDEFGDRTEGILNYLRKCTVVCILVSEVSEAFQLFDTQNGRGKELTPVNLLKAYHFHEMNRSSVNGIALSDRRVREIEARWERSNAMKVFDGKGLLSHVLSQHLFKLRHWSRGDDSIGVFSKKDMGEFQGLTIGKREDSLPLQNSAILRKLFRDHYKSFGFSLDSVGGRLGPDRRDPDGMDPFMTICQAIINGEDFFDYAETYSVIYRELFDVFEKREGETKSVSILDPELNEFRSFYRRYCQNYYGSRRIGDTYARHIFESLCIFCFDRFGSKGLLEFHRQLYRLSYYDRVINRRLFSQSAGISFAIKLIPFMLTSETMSELNEAIRKSIDMMTKECREWDKMLFKFDKDGSTNDDSPEIPRWQFVFGPENLKESNTKEA